MARKKSKPEEERKPEDNNWEIPEYPNELQDIFKDISDPEMKEKIYQAWLKVDPEIRDGNPVWKISVKSLHAGGFVFLFRTGQKVRM